MAQVSAFDRDRAAHTSQHSEKGKQQFLLPLPVEAAQADDLAAPGRKRHAVEAVFPGEIADLDKGRRAWSLRLRRELPFDLTADHEPDDLVAASHTLRESLDMPPVAEDRTAIRQSLDLVHAMGDIENAQATRFQIEERAIDQVHIGCRERGGGLVENEKLGITPEGLGDLHHLPAGQRKVCDAGRRVDILAADAGEQFLRPPALCPAIDQAEAARRARQGDVVSHCELGHQRELLKDANDAGAVRRRRVGKRDRHALEGHVALIRLHDACHDLHERRLAGAVLPQHRVDRATAAGKVHAPQGMNSPVALGDVLEGEEGRRFHRTPSMLGRRSSFPDTRRERSERVSALCSYWVFLASFAMISGAVTFTPQAGNSLAAKKLSERFDQ